MYFKVIKFGSSQTRCGYKILGIKGLGRKNVLNIYVSYSEGQIFRFGVIHDLKQRGVKDILIACIDNLKGFDEAVQTTYLNTEARTRIVHQIRNSLKYVASKD